MTRDVFAEVIADLGGRLRRVEITDLTDNTFHARLMVNQAGNEHTYHRDIRPSEAVALAVRTETPIYVGEAVFDQAGIVPTEVTEATGEPGSSEREVEIDESKLSPIQRVHRDAGHRRSRACCWRESRLSLPARGMSAATISSTYMPSIVRRDVSNFVVSAFLPLNIFV